jgi:hypothetical protein
VNVSDIFFIDRSVSVGRTAVGPTTTVPCLLGLTGDSQPGNVPADCS